jgi:hypothetical protein
MMFIDFNTDKLFGNKTNTIQTAKARLLNSKYPLGRKTYIQAAADHARQHKLFERLQNLVDTNERDDALIEKLDHIIGECCDNGEKKCRKTRPEWWTLKVNRLRTWRRILQKLQSSFKKHYRPCKAATNYDRRIENTNRTTNKSTRHDCRYITQARKDIRACLKQSKETRALEQLEHIEKKLKIYYL